jgi:hypothetical protein
MTKTRCILLCSFLEQGGEAYRYFGLNDGGRTLILVITAITKMWKFACRLEQVYDRSTLPQSQSNDDQNLSFKSENR